MPLPLVGIGAALAMVVLSGMVSSSCKPLFNMLSQQLFKLFPNELIPPVNLIAMRYKGLLDENQYYDECKVNGINQERATLLYDEAAQRLGAYDAINLWRRGGIDEHKRDEMIMKAGWSEERIEYLLNITKQIPSASDVIAFSVREVYSPEIAEAFGQYEGGERVYTNAETDITANGMDKETFMKFWAAHWTLPSVGQGYEMLHRQIIDDEMLDKLFEAQDIMPGWRPHLKAMSFNVFTRVDVRRMHKLGVIDDDALVKAYMDLGYTQDMAGQLAEFTILYNYDPESSQVTEEDKENQRLKETTQATVLSSYKKGLLDLTTTRQYLQDLGYSSGAIDLYIARADYENAEDIEEQQIAAIREGYIRSIFEYNDTVDKLGRLNLPAKLTDTLLERWQIERTARLSKPSKADLTKFLASGIISQDTFQSELRGLGYDPKYVNWNMQLTQVAKGGA